MRIDEQDNDDPEERSYRRPENEAWRQQQRDEEHDRRNQ